NGEITYKEAILHADSPNDLRLKIKLSGKNGNVNLDEGADSLSLDIT
ncbi:MAG: type IV pili twitching motility protein PilT, partial [Psychrobacter sp.]|nr:type IV pili twitching motility protein PilT [Psychrobacter sp.]